MKSAQTNLMKKYLNRSFDVIEQEILGFDLDF